MRYLTAFVSALLASGMTAGASAADYEKAVADSVAAYAEPDAFSGVRLVVGCRHMPEMDFIASHKRVFEKATGIKIDFVMMAENDLRGKLIADAKNGTGAFQVYCIDNNYISMFAINKWLAPLNQSIRPEYKVDDIFDKLRDSYTWHNDLYGLPVYSEITILYYRKDLLDAAGIQAPATIDALETSAAKLTSPPKQFGMALRGLRGEGMNVYTWTGWMRAYGANFLDAKMNPVFNSAKAIEATEHYADLIAKSCPPGSATWGWDKVVSAFASGRVAMTVDSTVFYQVFNDPEQSKVAGKVGYALVPAGPEGAYPASYSIGLAVPASVDHASKAYTAASAFIQWATSQEMEFARADENMSNMDRKSVNNSDLVKKKVDPAFIEAVAEGQRVAKVQYRPMIPQWREMGEIVGAEIEANFTGQKSAEAALNAAADKVAARFKEEGLANTPRAYPEIFPDK